MANNSSNTPATEGNDVFTGTSGNDQFTGAHGDDSITGGAGDDTLFGDGPLPGTWHYEVFTRDFSSASGQAFDIETGTRQAYGYVTDFDVGQLANSVQGTSGNPEDFGIVYTSELNVTAGGTYRIATRSDDGSTVQIFDSSGTPVSFANQTGGTLDYMNNDFHQGATTRFGDVVLNGGETYTIQIRYWENLGQDVLSGTISGADTGGVAEDLLTTSMLGLPPEVPLNVEGGVEGNDVINGGAGNDVIAGNGGDDTLTGGLDDDTLTGGDGNDTFVYNSSDGDDTITDFNAGNSGSLGDGDTTNNDFIDLSGYYDSISEVRADFDDDGALNQSNSTDNGGSVDYSDNDRMQSGDGITFSGADRPSFTTDNTGVVCFTSGTRILTPQGPVPIEFLRPGDLVVTRDNGPQPLLWKGARHLDPATLDTAPHLRPILIAPQLVGAEAHLIVSPQHGMLLRDAGGDERLFRAKHLAQMKGAQAQVLNACRAVTYIHLMFEAHQIVFANGAPTESFYPGPMALGALSLAQRAEMMALFPGLAVLHARQTYGDTARVFARRHALPAHVHALSAAA